MFTISLSALPIVFPLHALRENSLGLLVEYGQFLARNTIHDLALKNRRHPFARQELLRPRTQRCCESQDNSVGQ
jgi:hypothetical protein